MTHPHHRDDPRARALSHVPCRNGRRRSILLCAAITLFGIVVAAGAQAQTSTQIAPPAPLPQLGPMTQEQLEMAARYQECQHKLQDERSGGVITALRFGAAAIDVEVDAAKWGPMSADAKLALVQTVSCYAVAGNPKLNARVQVLDSRNQHKLGYYDGSELKLPES